MSYKNKKQKISTRPHIYKIAITRKRFTKRTNKLAMFFEFGKSFWYAAKLNGP